MQYMALTTAFVKTRERNFFANFQPKMSLYCAANRHVATQKYRSPLGCARSGTRFAFFDTMIQLPSILTIVLAVFMAFVPMTADAADLSSDKETCRRLTAKAEGQLRLPRHILGAIALAESGRWDAQKQEKTAWPWTVYAEGRGRYFESKAAALAVVRKLQARGVTNIDVGCMQINLYHHGKAFAALEDALDPVSNVDYAGNLLKSLQRQTRSWSMAIGYYHSRTARYNRPYRRKVRQLWDGERRRAARERRAAAKARARGRKS